MCSRMIEFFSFSFQRFGVWKVPMIGVYFVNYCVGKTFSTSPLVNKAGITRCTRNIGSTGDAHFVRRQHSEDLTHTLSELVCLFVAIADSLCGWSWLLVLSAYLRTFSSLIGDWKCSKTVDQAGFSHFF